MYDVIDCVRDLVAALKSGDYVSALGHAGHLFTEAEGLLRRLGGGPVVMGDAPDRSAEFDALCDDLERCKVGCEVPAVAGGVDPDPQSVAALNPAVVLALIEAALRLAELLKRRRAA